MNLSTKHSTTLMLLLVPLRLIHGIFAHYGILLPCTPFVLVDIQDQKKTPSPGLITDADWHISKHQRGSIYFARYRSKCTITKQARKAFYLDLGLFA